MVMQVAIMKGICVVLLFAAVVSNPVGNSNDTAVAEKGNSLLTDVMGDIKTFMKGMMSNLRSAMQDFPANYTNSEITTNDFNGTLVQTNTTIMKNTGNSHVMFHMSRHNKILKTANSTNVTTN